MFESGYTKEQLQRVVRDNNHMIQLEYGHYIWYRNEGDGMKPMNKEFKTYMAARKFLKWNLRRWYKELTNTKI